MTNKNSLGLSFGISSLYARSPVILRKDYGSK